MYYYFTGQTWHPDIFPFSSCHVGVWVSWEEGSLCLGGRLFDSLLVLSDGVADRLFESRDGRSRKEGWSGVCAGRANKIKTKKKGIFQAGS